jgi:glycosyltransferase involved in cell wall biosynthesis
VEALVGRSTYGTVAYPGKDHFLPPPLPKDFDKTLRLVHVANISDYKGLDVLIEGLTNHSDFSLAVVGRIIDPAFFDYVQQLIKERGLENKVRFLGLQSGERVHQQLEKSHIFALPSFYESFGIAYIEALGHGLPIIGTNSGGIKEIITDGEEGFLVPSGNPEMIAQHLEEMQEDRSMLRRMSKAALERYRSLPTWGESVNRIHDLLLSLKN